jgi:hypothetical protein
MPLFKKLSRAFSLRLYHPDGRPVFVGWQHDPDRSKVERYRRALRKGATFPPIAVYHRSPAWGPENAGWEIVDGHHRFHGTRLEGRETIRCRMNDPWFADGTTIDEFIRENNEGPRHD